MLVYILSIPCKLFSQDVGSEGIDNRLARTDWFQCGGEVDPDFTLNNIKVRIKVLKSMLLGAMTVLR